MESVDKMNYDSPFTYIPGLKLELEAEVNDGMDISSLFSSGQFGRAESYILDALYKYPFLNMECIRRYCDVVFEEHREKSFYRHRMKELLELSLVQKATYGDQIFYYLSIFARKQLKKKKGYDVFIPNEVDESAVLEYASLGQWHIAMMEGERNNLTQSTLYQERKLQKKSLLVPSYMSVKKGKYTYRIFSFSSPRGRENLVPYLTMIKDMWNEMSQYKKRGVVTLTVITVYSLREIYALRTVMDQYYKDYTNQVYFAVDGNTAAFGGLTCLYYFDKRDTSLLKVVDVKG